MMATAAALTNTDLSLECPVCMERYRDPRVLQCAHHFCKVCLEEIADRHPQGSVTCPTCRHVTSLEGENGASKLPRYRLINEYIEQVDEFVTSCQDTGVDKLCDACSKTTATRTCLQCPMNFCSTCVLRHDKLQTITKHQTNPISPYLFCSHHGAHVICYCLDCNEGCCMKCSLFNHEGHKMADVHEKADARRKLLNDNAKNIEVDGNERKVLSKLEDLLRNANTFKTQFLEDIRSLKATLQSMMDKVETLTRLVTPKVDSEIKHLEMMVCDMQEYCDSRKRLKDTLNDILEETSDYELVGREVNIPKYDPDFYKELLCKPEIELPDLGTTLSDVTTKLGTLQEQLCITFTKNNVDETKQNTRKPFGELKQISTFNTGKGTLGLVIDSKRQRLVVRRTDTKAPITVYDFQGQQLQILGTGVTNITGANHQGIAIDTKRDVYILPMSDGSLVTMDMKGTVNNRIQVTNTGLHGVAYTDTDFYVTSSGNPHKVYTINPKTQQKVASFSPNTTFNNPFNVSSGQYTPGRVVYPVITVSNHHSHCIQVLDMSGHLLHTYGKEGQQGQGDGELQYPWGVCTDPGGRLIIGDTNNYRVMSVWGEKDAEKWKTQIT